MIQPLAGSLAFSHRQGLFVKLSRSGLPGPPALLSASPFSRTFKHFRHLADALFRVTYRGRWAQYAAQGWFTQHGLSPCEKFRSMWVVCTYMYTLLLWPWQTGLPHVMVCFDCQGKQGYSRAQCPCKEGLSPTHLDKLAVAFTSLFSPSSHTFFASLCLNLLKSFPFRPPVASVISTRLQYSQPSPSFHLFLCLPPPSSLSRCGLHRRMQLN